jgi:endo-1,4-beta-D-glucanase Y
MVIEAGRSVSTSILRPLCWGRAILADEMVRTLVRCLVPLSLGLASACGTSAPDPDGPPSSGAGGTGGQAGSAQGGSGAAGTSSGAGIGGTGGISGSGGSSGGTPGGSSGMGGAFGGAQGGSSGAGGIPMAGNAGNSAGAGGAVAGSGGNAGATSSGGGAGIGGVWHAAIAGAVTDEMLASEYAAWKMRHVQTCPDGSAVVKKDAGSVVSEGIAYGMLLAVAQNDRTLLDGLWKYYQDHLDPKGLMNWSTGVCDPAGNNNANAATDAELDAAMALIQAEARFPGSGYLAEAELLAEKIVMHETEICDGRAILRPGDNFGGCSDENQPRINPSYFAPGYYRVFAARFPAQAERWNALTEGTYALYPLYQARMEGLVPDWSRIDGSDWSGAGYSYDACRTPWRVMIDYAFSGDARARTFLENVNTWVSSHSLTSPHPNNSAFVGALALASAVDQTAFDAAVATWLGAMGDDMPYFQGTLRVLYLHAAAGKFPSTL